MNGGEDVQVKMTETETGPQQRVFETWRMCRPDWVSRTLPVVDQSAERAERGDAESK